jgi:hypothetical protein
MQNSPNNKKHELRHVVVQKAGVFGNLVLHIDCVRCATACFVPRTDPPQVLRSYESPDQARSAFADIVQIFKNHGWTTIHDGRPNFG